MGSSKPVSPEARVIIVAGRLTDCWRGGTETSSALAELFEAVRTLENKQHAPETLACDCPVPSSKPNDSHRADCPVIIAVEQQPTAWRYRNGFGDWHFTVVKPDARELFWEPLYAAPTQKGGKPRLATDEIRDIACCDTFVRESASEFCATCGYSNLDHLRKRSSQKAKLGASFPESTDG